MINNEIRAGSGLGDSIYLQSVVRHLAARGERLIVRSNYPDVFKNLEVPVVPMRKFPECRVAHYTLRKSIQGTSQFTDMCMRAGIAEPVDLTLDWERCFNFPKRSIAVMLPRNPMNRSDGFGHELNPDYRIIDQLISQQTDHFFIQVGKGKPLFDYSGISLDMANKTSIHELIDACASVDGFIGICSFMIPLAESLNKPYFALWSNRGLKSRTTYIRSITPKKIIHKPGLAHYAIDNEPIDRIRERFGAFLRQAAG